jgi:hypothetical protein
MSIDQASAYQHIITAEFVPSLDKPDNNVFTNTSHSGMLCTTMPALCDFKKSLVIAGRSASQSPFLANAPDPRQGWSIKTPAEWREITVRHTGTNETNKVELRMTGVGGRFQSTPEASYITGIQDPQAAHEALWNGGGLGNAPAPCIGKYSEVVSLGSSVRFLWQTPVASACAKQSAFDIDKAYLYDLELLYELRTPTPLDMSAGTWESEISYSMGPGGDFDFGDNLLPAVSSLDIKISLSVAHHLRVVFPPSATRLALEPDGGWVPWLSRGRRPERIMRDQSFRFTTSGPVKMRIECQYDMNGNCGLDNAVGHRVPVETRISLPDGMHELTGGPVSKRLLTSLDDVAALANRYVADQTGQLHFEISRADVDAMLSFPDTTYSGDVTVVWDSYLMP